MASSDFPWVPIAVLAVLLIALIAALIYWLSRSKPYGYLYNDKDEPVADFGQLKRRPAMALLFKNLVSGSELGLPGLEGVSFRFFRRRIGLAAKSDSPTVRVNNQPVIGESTIRDGSWIGAHGKLYSFLMSQPLPPAPRTRRGRRLGPASLYERGESGGALPSGVSGCAPGRYSPARLSAALRPRR